MPVGALCRRATARFSRTSLLLACSSPQDLHSAARQRSIPAAAARHSADSESGALDPPDIRDRPVHVTWSVHSLP